jgi:hypothetical protein
VLKAHGGIEVKTMGDGFMASFRHRPAASVCRARRRTPPRPRRPQRRRTNRRGRRPLRRHRHPRLPYRGEGGGRGDPGGGHCARVVLGQGVLVWGPRRVRGEGVRGAGARVRGELARWLSLRSATRGRAMASTSPTRQGDQGVRWYNCRQSR